MNSPLIPLNTVDGVVAWIKKHVPPEAPARQWSGDAAMKAAMWWLAIGQAEGLHDFTTKDFAEMLIDGLEPLTVAQLAEYLDTMDTWDIESSLAQHFGLR